MQGRVCYNVQYFLSFVNLWLWALVNKTLSLAMNVDLKLGMGLVHMLNFLFNILFASFFILHCGWLNEKYLQLLLCFSVVHSCESVGFVTFNLAFESTLLFHFIHM